MKKNMLITFRFLILLLMIAVPFSCSDFLDKSPQGKLLSTNFPTSASDALQAVNGVYNTMRIPEYSFGLFPILDIMSDDAHKGSNPADQRAIIGPYDNFTHVATEPSIKSWYITLFLGVKRANVVIENVPSISMDPALRNRYVGEARFLRAFFYFDLVRAWGEVPIVTSVNASLGLERAPVEQVHALIEEDLLFASQNLWERDDERFSTDDAGRVTKGAADAMLARFYLWQGNFTDAETYAMTVVNSNKYDLEPAFGDANGEAGEYGEESVFEIGAFRNEGLVKGGNQYANVQGVRGSPNRGWGFNRASEDLRTTFEPGDPRLDSTMLELGEYQDGIRIMGDGDTPDVGNNGVVYPDFPTGLVVRETYNQKVWTPGSNVPTQWGHNRRIIRYADVLLMAAEALNENDKPADALIYLNEVRQRARGGNTLILPDISETNKDLLRDIIFHERRVELALEGHRFWDLIRTDRAEEVLGPYGFDITKHKLLAIPQSEIDLTGWQQNDNW